MGDESHTSEPARSTTVKQPSSSSSGTLAPLLAAGAGAAVMSELRLIMQREQRHAPDARRMASASFSLLPLALARANATVTMNTRCARLDRSFMLVAATWQRRLPAAISENTSSALVTGTCSESASESRKVQTMRMIKRWQYLRQLPHAIHTMQSSPTHAISQRIRGNLQYLQGQ